MKKDRDRSDMGTKYLDLIFGAGIECKITLCKTLEQHTHKTPVT